MKTLIAALLVSTFLPPLSPPTNPNISTSNSSSTLSVTTKQHHNVWSAAKCDVYHIKKKKIVGTYEAAGDNYKHALKKVLRGIRNLKFPAQPRKCRQISNNSFSGGFQGGGGSQDW